MTRTRTIAGGAATLAALALATYAVAARETSSVASYTGCLKNGKIESVAVGDGPLAPCGTGQTQVRLSGGDITRVHARPGLLGGGDNGDLELGVDPRIVQNRVTGDCRGAPLPTDASISAIHEDGTVTCNTDDRGHDTDVIAGFWDGPEAMPRTGANAEPPPIAQLPLPAGKYAISATLDVTALEDTTAVTCKLVAGGDFDQTFVTLEAPDSLPDQKRLALNVVHEFIAPGVARIDCGELFGLADEWSFLKITAIRVANLTNGPLTLIPRGAQR